VAKGLSKAQKKLKARRAHPPVPKTTSPLRGEDPMVPKGPKQAPLPEPPAPPKVENRKPGVRSPEQYARDQEAVAILHLKGWSGVKMEAHLDLSKKVIADHLDNLGPYFREVAKVSVDERKGRQLKLLDYLIETAVDGIERAQLPLKKRTVEGRTGPKGAQGDGGNLGGKVTETTEPGRVDGSLLQATRGLLSHEADLLGMKTHPELKVILEERRAGKDLLIQILKEEIKDPELLRRIADRMSSVGAEPEVKAA
jgi:hypothetical protein